MSNCEKIAELTQERDKLLGQLPEGMKHCTIRFIECPVGHGRLTADNWVDNGCHWCKIVELQNSLRKINDITRNTR